MKRTLIALLVLLTATTTSTWALDFAQPIKQLDGSDFTGQDGKPEPLTLEKVVETALMAQFPDDRMSGDEKAKRYGIAMKIYSAKDKRDVQLSIDEVKVIKDVVGKAYGPSVVGPAWQILDPNGSINNALIIPIPPVR
jgi:hypothetical protein